MHSWEEKQHILHNPKATPPPPMSEFPQTACKLRNSGIQSFLSLRMLCVARGDRFKSDWLEDDKLRPPWLRTYPQPKVRLSQHRPAARRALRRNLSSIRLRKERVVNRK